MEIPSLSHSIAEIDMGLTRESTDASSIKYEKSLKYNFQALAELWHPVLNIISADKVTKASNEKAYWVCSNCDYGSNGEWIQTIVAMNPKYRTRLCPNCSYDWVRRCCVTNNKKGKRGRKMLRIDMIYPNLTDEWNNSVTDKSISEVKQADKGYWKCIECSYEWESTISVRIQAQTGCPNCGYNSFTDTYKSVTKILFKGENDLLSQFPELCKEWDFTKNEIRPDEIFKTYKKEVNWKCLRCEHEWLSPVVNRTNGLTGCPECGYNWHRAQIGAPQKMRAKYIVKLKEEGKKHVT